MPPDPTTDGHRVEALLHGALGLTAALAVAFVVALGYLVYRGRPRARQGSPATPPSPTLAVSLALAALVFGVIDLALAASSRRAHAGPPPPDALRVEVLAQKWSWHFRYAGPDGVFGTADDVTTLNDLRLPAGRAVSLQVRSLDVVHEMFLPMLRARASAFPGRVSPTWFRTDREGHGEAVCSVMCGEAHYQMRAEVTVLSDEQYARWMSGLIDGQRGQVAAPGNGWGWSWAP